MKIVRTLKITADEFFDQVERGLAARVCRETGQDAAGACIVASGSRFVEHEGDPRRRTEIRVIEYTPGQRFESRTVSATDDITMSYEVCPDEKGPGITVTYRQDMASFNARKKGFMKGFSEAVYLGRMAEQLFALEDEVLKTRQA